MGDLNYYLRNMVKSDWESFHQMEKEIFPKHPIKKETFIDSLTRPLSLFKVAINQANKEIIGYYFIIAEGNEGRIYRIGVHSDFRQQGLGTELLESAIKELQDSKVKIITLFVERNNEAALHLYKKYGFKIDKMSLQFEFPFDEMLEKPKGQCRQLLWSEIPLFCLRFNQNPARIKRYFSQEEHILLVYEYLGKQFGFCRFTPDFPGAMPFLLSDLSYAFDFIALLEPYATNRSYDALKITLEGQNELAELFKKKDKKIISELYLMKRPTKI